MRFHTRRKKESIAEILKLAEIKKGQKDAGFRMQDSG